MGIATAILVLGATLVTVKAEHRVCASDADCTHVVTHCGGCQSCGEPVRLMYRKEYLEQVTAACEDDTGPVCDVGPCEKKMRCVAKQCAWVAAPAAAPAKKKTKK